MRPLRTNETRARRLDSLMCNLIFSAVFLALCLCALGFLATRTHMFHCALMRRQQNVLNNMWLLQQCKSPDFYSNMKQHSTLCDNVVLEQTDALWLHALRDVINETYFCGNKPCIYRVEQVIVWVFGRGVLLLGVLAGSALFVFLTAVQMQRHLNSRPHESYRMLHYPVSSDLVAEQYPLLHDSETNPLRMRTRAEMFRTIIDIFL